MRKIIILSISILFLTSCGSKKRTTSIEHKKRTVIVKNRAKKPIVKPIKHQTEVKVKTPLYIDVSENATFFDKDALDVIYANKPNLFIAKVDYIKKYSELAIHEMETYKIPASITLAQGLLESKYGQSTLTKKAKNHFGIKCHKWTGKRVYHDDDEKGECFRKYEMHESSFRDHSLFLAQKKRYAKLFKLSPKDYKSWARGLRAAGYATDKKYPEKLISLIEEYELYYFDNLVLGKEYVFKETVEEPRNVIIETEAPIKVEVPTEVAKPQSATKPKFHIVKVGETLYSISRLTNVAVNDIKKYNNLIANEIAINQKLQLFESLVIEPESPINEVIEDEVIEDINSINKEIIKDKYIKYTVKTGDTIYSIARNYNTTVAYLIKVNNLESNSISIGQSLIVDIKK